MLQTLERIGFKINPSPPHLVVFSFLASIAPEDSNPSAVLLPVGSATSGDRLCILRLHDDLFPGAQTARSGVRQQQHPPVFVAVFCLRRYLLFRPATNVQPLFSVCSSDSQGPPATSFAFHSRCQEVFLPTVSPLAICCQDRRSPPPESARL